MPKFPPYTANIELACYTCYKDAVELDGKKLMRCSVCKRVAYCSPESQKTDWSKHKPLCKIFNGVEKDPRTNALLPILILPEPSSDIEILNANAERARQNEWNLTEAYLKRPLKIEERSLVAHQPRCMACCRTERIMRMEGKEVGLMPCSSCCLAFCCSQEHRDVVRDLHSNQPCPIGKDGRTQCQLNLEVLQDIELATLLNPPDAPTDEITWSPKRVKTSWDSVLNTSWEAEFAEHACGEFNIFTDYERGKEALAAFMRAVSDGLSMPMTILWALERMKPDLAWTRKETLEIHIIGGADKAVMDDDVFEEILHRLPDVKTLKIVLVNPSLIMFMQSTKTDTVHMKSCRECEARGQKRVHTLFADMYDNYVVTSGSTYSKPDLLIALNVPMGLEGIPTWRPTFDILARSNIPTIFTAFNRRERSMIIRFLLKLELD